VGINNTTIFKSLRKLMMYLRRGDKPLKYSDEEPLLRSELFSVDQLEDHGRHLAASHELTQRYPQVPLLTRLEASEHLLIGVYDKLREAVEAKRRISPASEWLIDNFYLIEEQIRTAKSHLPKGYSLELPRCSTALHLVFLACMTSCWRGSCAAMGE